MTPPVLTTAPLTTGNACPVTTARLRDGTRLAMRPLGDGEREPVLDVFEAMSPQSRFLRFLYPVPRLPESMLRPLTRLDGRDRVAWGAFCGSRCVGIARFVRSAHQPDSADLAVAVSDAMQGRGLGRLLLGVLAGVAEAHGLTTFTVSVHPDNRSSLAILRSCSARLRLIDGVYEGTVATSAMRQRIPTPRTPGPQLAVA